MVSLGVVLLSRCFCFCSSTARMHSMAVLVWVGLWYESMKVPLWFHVLFHRSSTISWDVVFKSAALIKDLYDFSTIRRGNETSDSRRMLFSIRRIPGLVSFYGHYFDGSPSHIKASRKKFRATWLPLKWNIKEVKIHKNEPSCIFHFVVNK